MGSVLAFKLSVRLGLAPAADLARIERHFATIGLRTRIAQIPGPRPTVDEILSHMRHDKKAQGGEITFILANGIGHALIANGVPEDAVRAVLTED